MILGAIKVLGALHALFVYPCAYVGFAVLRLSESEHYSRRWRRNRAIKFFLLAVVLALCGISAWQQPSIAWIFAVLSLVVYILPSSSLRPRSDEPVVSPFMATYYRYAPYVATARVIAAFLLVLATYLPGG
jgi:hypothetical protein